MTDSDMLYRTDLDRLCGRYEATMDAVPSGNEPARANHFARSCLDSVRASE
jgi:hypothetical protein